MEFIELVIGAAVLVGLAAVALVAGLVRRGGRSRTRTLPPRPTAREDRADRLPGVGDDAEVPRDSATRTIEDVTAGGGLDLLEPPPPPTPVVDRPASAAGRLVRLRERLARSNTTLGRGLLALLSRDTVDEETWEEVEDTLLMADLGVGPTQELVTALRQRVGVLGARTPDAVRAVLREQLVAAVDPSMDRSLRVGPHLDGAGLDGAGAGRPAVVLVVGVNGTGKTTTAGKLARLLVADDKDVVLAAADTFRAAAAEQLTTWGDRVGVPTIRSDKEGADPASVAFEGVKAAAALEADVLIIDTAGRLQTKTGLMDELGKLKRVAERAMGTGADGAPHTVDEVLLVLDATTGQNGLRQAKVFSEVVAVTGIVLTKLDGTAKGGIVVAVQRELGVPVKLVGLGEGVDDLAPFEPEAFVDALLA
ncbi:MAG: Signal recognition particle receptor FtsY [uncultured Quadrisphaera sp.]|uniref:Signal recognition particle receptor FtsY n=1 Tax=uncultured Quadrisphaera sp. TaxID=904978 RepID=A0A6J4PI25_9ACTN|nr:MAG: Signal recognition particle receptor FtsY [uncultured Quadrisphaera sp.]